MNNTFPILIVDDESMTRKLLAHMLTKEGHEVDVAESAQEALTKLKERFFPIVLTDWMMPGMTGPELCRTIRETITSGYVFIILLTGKDSRSELIEGLAAGADDYVTKPINRDELLARLNSGLRILNLELSLRKANREMQDFSYIASHDLQEPLRKITAFSDRLEASLAGTLGEKQQDYLNRMRGAAKRMQELIEALLAYSRVTTRGQPFTKVDLNIVIAEVLGDLEVRIAETGGKVTHGTLPVLDADVTQMRQLLQNLIGNGLKYHKRDVPPVIEISSTTDEKLCTITIKDNGIGFEQKYAEQIFGVFQRLHGKSSEYSGSGVGLSVCRKIATRHGGDVSAVGVPDEGAVFTVVLPLSHAEAVG